MDMQQRTFYAAARSQLMKARRIWAATELAAGRLPAFRHSESRPCLSSAYPVQTDIRGTEWSAAKRAEWDERYQMARARAAIRVFYAKKAFDESKHPRAPKGRADGGRFVKSGDQSDRASANQKDLLWAREVLANKSQPAPMAAPSQNANKLAGSSKTGISQNQAQFSVPPERANLKILQPSDIPDLLDVFPLLPNETLDEMLGKLGYSLQDHKAYQLAWQSIALRKMGVTPHELDGYTDFRLHNQQVMRAIYGYYQSLYDHNPDLLWAGMAKLAGRKVWNGLHLNLQLRRRMPGAGLDRLSTFFERELVRMNREIFEDLGWMHEAYRTNGMREIDRLYRLGALNRDIHDAWSRIDKGIRDSNEKLVHEGNAQLLRREQEVVLKRGYRELSKRNLGVLMGTIAENPIPGGQHFNDIVKGGDLANFEDRWKWIEKDMIGRWNSMTRSQRRALVDGPIDASGPDFRPPLPVFDLDDEHRMTHREYKMLIEGLEKLK